MAEWIVVVLYFAIMIGIGIRSYLVQKNQEFATDEYWIAQRKMAGFHLGVSLCAGWTEAIWSFWVVGAIYGLGYWVGMIATPLPMLMLWIIMFFIIKPIRRFPAVSQPEMMELRYGPQARLLLGILMFPILAGWGASALMGMGYLAETFLGISHEISFVIAAVVIGIYGVLGGFRSVVYTDVVQMAVMFVAFLIVGTILAIQAFNSVGSEFFTAIAQNPPPLSGSYWHVPWTDIVITLLAFLPGWIAQPDMWLRFQAAKSEKEAFRGTFYGMTVYSIAVGLMLMFIGTAALIVYPPTESILPAFLGGDEYNLFPYMVRDLLPTGIALMMLAGLTAAVMSSVDTAVNVAALSLGYDVFDRFVFRPRGWDSRHLTNIGRMAVALAVLIALVIALQADVFTDVLYLVGAWMTCTYAIPLFFMWWKKSNLTGAMCGMCMGFFGSAILYALEMRGWLPVPGTVYGIGYIFYAIALTIIVIIIGSRFGRPPSKEQLQYVSTSKYFVGEEDS